MTIEVSEQVLTAIQRIAVTWTHECDGDVLCDTLERAVPVLRAWLIELGLWSDEGWGEVIRLPSFEGVEDQPPKK
jgi:hypothetical protein